jgi:hypothetical protein
LYCQFPATVVTEKNRANGFVDQKTVFSTQLFLPKTHIKHHKKLDKPIHGFKKPKELS